MRTGQIARSVTAALAALALSSSACSEVAGGAVELSWRLRPTSGVTPDNSCYPFVCCDSGIAGTTPVARIALMWTETGDGGPTTTRGSSWSCDDGNGVTGFELPPGPTVLEVVPVCQDLTIADASEFVAPPPIGRDVIAGDTITLGAVEILLQVTSCGSGSGSNTCICDGHGSDS